MDSFYRKIKIEQFKVKKKKNENIFKNINDVFSLLMFFFILLKYNNQQFVLYLTLQSLNVA